MGSLMAGWQTKPRNAQQAALKRSTSSMTNDEVTRYWRAKENSIKEHLEEAQMAAGFFKAYQKFEMNDDSYDIKEGAVSLLPSAPTLNGPQDAGKGRKADWWTKSKFAYLNEPPLVNEGKQNRYLAQFEVATKGRDNVIAARARCLLNANSACFYNY
ncbi:hypothetical protein MPTK1_6g09190 [Marchantia polymorpha subsp. ruderalis]|uniref:Uncharacterized protein n=2 Tax=Marchantia polymorpha TaxID=3197 RepID=A0A176WAD6_MARPO|nr:hypothetical protein AXG93_1762s1240 [Marchantia polymorpha subsp. ruderalis]PTQ28922.1 hypothetical protein MARPO_0152s0035 [Marchantia polymorpha]BBN14140.1 hypothetical protein Mp_6g09190 [Marchantia polymorpha subsp. ruderalis]|eukprot:PTQ28922.1 hypothetical protein MARPO_0152s0035 [Marchantia polymorpha]